MSSLLLCKTATSHSGALTRISLLIVAFPGLSSVLTYKCSLLKYTDHADLGHSLRDAFYNTKKDSPFIICFGIDADPKTSEN